MCVCVRERERNWLTPLITNTIGVVSIRQSVAIGDECAWAFPHDYWLVFTLCSRSTHAFPLEKGIISEPVYSYGYCFCTFTAMNFEYCMCADSHYDGEFDLATAKISILMIISMFPDPCGRGEKLLSFVNVV